MYRAAPMEWQGWLTLAVVLFALAGMVRKLLESAIANAEHNEGADIDELKVAAIFVDEGRTLKRFRARAKGRGTRILKRNSHITVTVGDTH